MFNSLLHVGTVMEELEKPRELIAKSLKCWAMFEKLVADLYELVAKKTSDEALSLSLKWISTESRSHFTYLENLSAMIGGVKEYNCAEFIGIPWLTNESLLRDVSEVEQVDVNMALNILRKLQKTEKLASEEVYSMILSNLLKDLTSLIDINEELLRAVLEEISMEEKHHSKIVELLIDYLSKALEANNYRNCNK